MSSAVAQGCGAEYAAWKVSAHGDEADALGQGWLQMAQGGADFSKMLVGERFVYRQIVVAPAEMGGDGGLYSRAGASRDSRSVHASFKTAGGGEGRRAS